MHVDFDTAQKTIAKIEQEYLLSISSLANHNHFRTDRSSGRYQERGFSMLTNRNQYILDEEHFLEGCTRVFLINPIMKMLLDMAGIQNDWKYGNTFGEFNISNREYELGSFVEFILEKGGKNIGCRYTPSWYRGHEAAAMDKDSAYLFKHKSVPGFEKLTHVDEIWCIDWSNENHVQNEINPVPGMINSSKSINVKEFFEIFFSHDVYELFITETSGAIKQAQSIIALEAAPQLMPNNILAFKDSIIVDLTEEKMEGYAYRFNKARYVGLVSTLTDSDIAVIKDAFFEKGYRYALIGNADFAQSYITSEYLFSTIKSGLSIDYTSVVVGYLKSVEQLLYALYISAFKDANEMCYWDACTRNQKSFDPTLPQYRYDPYDEHRSRMQEKYYHKKRVGTSAPEIGALAQFLRYHDECWNISESGKEFVFACLDDFRSYCRNHHFHKDNISHDQYDKVEIIRNNSIVCLYYLLGAFKFLDENRSTYEQLGIVDYAFEGLFRAIWEKRRRLFWVTSSDGYNGIIYYNGLIAPNGFDASGRMQDAQLHFVKFPHMNRDNAYVDDIVRSLDDVEYVQAHTLTITHDHMPKEMIPIMPPKKKRKDSSKFHLIAQCKLIL